MGNLTSQTDAAGAGDTFRYDRDGNVAESTDRNNRLVKVSDCAGAAMTYHYGKQGLVDRAGNRLTRTTQDIREEYSHDAAGRLTERSVYKLLQSPKLPNTAQKVTDPKTYHYEYDRQGNTLSDGENTYCYDSLNRIVEVQTKRTLILFKQDLAFTAKSVKKSSAIR